MVNSRENTSDIAIHNGLRETKGKTRHRPCRVRTDAGQRQNGGVILWEHPVVLFDHLFGKTLKISRTAIIPQSLPGLQYFFLTRLSKSGEIRELIQPAFVEAAIQHRRDLGLLQHHLRDKDGVRIAGAPPGIIATAFAKPSHEC